MNSLQVELCYQNSILPVRGSEHSAGFDLYSCESGIIDPWCRKLINIGIKISIPTGTYGRIAPRSGLAVNNGIHVGAGVIDSDYRGELKVLLFNMSGEQFKYQIHDRIAQLIVEQLAQINQQCQLVQQHEDTQRGCNGFGSTGTSSFTSIQ